MWEKKPYWNKRERLLAAIRRIHWEKVRDNTKLDVTTINKELEIINNLNKRIPQ
jgi:hypothetical protein